LTASAARKWKGNRLRLQDRLHCWCWWWRRFRRGWWRCRRQLRRRRPGVGLHVCGPDLDTAHGIRTFIAFPNHAGVPCANRCPFEVFEELHGDFRAQHAVPAAEKPAQRLLGFNHQSRHPRIFEALLVDLGVPLGKEDVHLRMGVVPPRQQLAPEFTAQFVGQLRPGFLGEGQRNRGLFRKMRRCALVDDDILGARIRAPIAVAQQESADFVIQALPT